MMRRGSGARCDASAPPGAPLIVTSGKGLGREIQGYLEIGNSNSHGERPFYYNRLDDPVDSDQ